jgi:nitrate/TMAO reductase-like tetraheme cytochrome c subunit
VDSILNTTKIKNIKRKCKLSNTIYVKTMQTLREKIKFLETVVENPQTTWYKDGSKKKYYYVPLTKLL